MREKARRMMPSMCLMALPFAVVVALAYASGDNGGPAAKSTAAVGNISMLHTSNDAQGGSGWVTLMENTLHTSSQKDIFCDVSLEVGLYTNTFVASGGGGGGGGNGNGGGNKSSATSEAAVKVRVWVDDELCYPGEVVFGKRTVTLEAEFQGFIADCLIIDENGNIIVDEDCVEPETLRLVLDTMHAASFNFILPNPGVGTHTIKCEAYLTTDTAADEGNDSEASAMIGKGSMTVEVVRMVQNEDIEI